MGVGLDVERPPEPDDPATYDYDTCPFYGDLAVRGQVIEGLIASTAMDRTVVVEREYDVFVPKYDRYMKRRSRIPAHVPGVLEPLSVGDRVKIAECRPLSKTKSHVVVEVVEPADAVLAAEIEARHEPEAPSSVAAEDEDEEETEAEGEDEEVEG